MLQFSRNEFVEMIEDGEDMEEKQKKKTWCGIQFVVFLIIIVLLMIGMLICWFRFFLPSSPNYTGYNIEGVISVKINGEIVIPENIICYGGSEHNPQYQDIKLEEYDDYVSLKLTAASYNNYHFEFDVNTSGGKKHFRFDVFKAYNGGPVRKFEYELSEADGKWNVSLVDLYGGKIQKETYSEFDTFIETGP